MSLGVLWHSLSLVSASSEVWHPQLPLLDTSELVCPITAKTARERLALRTFWNAHARPAVRDRHLPLHRHRGLCRAVGAGPCGDGGRCLASPRLAAGRDRSAGRGPLQDRAAFPTASDTAVAALAAQLAFVTDPWADLDRPVTVRMAMHTIAAESRDGPGLNRLADAPAGRCSAMTVLSPGAPYQPPAS